MLHRPIGVLFAVLGAPVVLLGVVLGAGSGAVAVLAFVLLGWWLWIAAEYWIHRWMDGKGWEEPVRRAHRLHHARPHEMQLGNSLASLGAFLFAVGVSGVLGALAIAWWVLPLAAGFACGGAAYSLVHWRCHNAPTRALWRAEQRLREHHLHHHFVDSRANFGFSASVWDHVWGTWSAPGRLPVGNVRLPAWAQHDAPAAERGA